MIIAITGGRDFYPKPSSGAAFIAWCVKLGVTVVRDGELSRVRSAGWREDHRDRGDRGVAPAGTINPGSVARAGRGGSGATDPIPNADDRSRSIG
jgi:hypothetical protein